MERKTKHRILGIIVVVAVVFLCLPFMQRNKDMTADTTVINKPSFPAQQDMQTLVPDDTIPEHTQHVPIADQSALPIKAEPIPDNTMKTFDQNNQSSVFTQQQDIDEALKELTSEKKFEQKKKETSKNAILAEKSFAKERVVHHEQSIATRIKPKTPVVTDNGLFDIKVPVWVVQVASFNSKAKAMHLINQLRANQYSAFLQQIKTANGVNHLVFVGPELEDKIARSLAKDIEKEHHVKGIVVSYKPMTLA